MVFDQQNTAGFFSAGKITAVPTAGLLIERVFVIWLVFRYPAVSSHETATKVKLLIPAVKHNQRYFWTPRTGFVRCLGRFLGQPAVFWLRWFPRTGPFEETSEVFFFLRLLFFFSDFSVFF